ncbi:mRNA binding protein [Malassezia pachydermatis]
MTMTASEEVDRRMSTSQAGKRKLVGRKVHVNNLPVNARISDLFEILERYGDIISFDIRVIKRADVVSINSQVTFKKPISAHLAVQQLHGSDLHGQPLEVSLYVPKHIKSMQSADNSIPEGTESNHTNDLSAMRSSDNASAPSTQASATEEAISPTKTSVTAQEHSVSGAAQPSPRSEKAKTSIKGIPSNTLLYVSHLSYSVNNDTLMEFFAPYGVKSAKVIRHRHRPSLSRGFAFADFSSHENQQKAMLEKNGVELHGRSISITVALQSPTKEENTHVSNAGAHE